MGFLLQSYYSSKGVCKLWKKRSVLKLTINIKEAISFYSTVCLKVKSTSCTVSISLSFQLAQQFLFS